MLCKQYKATMYQQGLVKYCLNMYQLNFTKAENENQYLMDIY